MMLSYSKCVVLTFFLSSFAFTLVFGANTHTLFRHSLIEQDGLAIWTIPPSERLFKNTARPTATAPHISVFAARGEFEPFVCVGTSSAALSVPFTLSGFPAEVTFELFHIEYVPITTPSDFLSHVGDWPDPLWPISNGETISITANENYGVWVLLKVLPSCASGDYLGTISFGSTVSVSVKLHVFNFELPKTLHVHSQMNMNINTVLQRYGVSGTGDDYWLMVDKIKLWMLEHRLQPSGPLWSGGLTSNQAPYISYNCSTHIFTDKYGIWGFEQPARKYILGQGFGNGTGFPDFAAMWMRTNDASEDQRPTAMCGITRSSSDWTLPISTTSNYNSMWFTYIAAIQSYLTGLGLLDKAYLYLWNEPQNQADYDAVAAYSQVLKTYAPNLKLMVSEEPKPEIYAHPSYPNSKIDIWLPVLNNFNPTISSDRMKNFDEATWVYFLTHNNEPPYFDPIHIDHPGIENLFTGPFLWKYRIQGIAYYSWNDWSVNPWTTPHLVRNGDRSMFYPPSRSNTAIAYNSNGNRLVPSQRIELMRDSLDIYEYFYILNGNSDPQPGKTTIVDTLASEVVVGLRSYTRDDEFLSNLHKILGQRIAGEIPDLAFYPLPRHLRAQTNATSYHINFQDPDVAPLAPLIVDGKEWMRIGWASYSEEKGYGWYGKPAQRMYGSASTSNLLHNTILYDDYGEYQSFQFDLPMATYDVTVCVGWEGRNYTHNTVTVNGVPFFSEQPNYKRYLTVTKRMTLNVPAIHLEIGCSHREYTMIVYLDIELITTLPADCSSNPCGENAVCVPPPGTCVCDTGYSGDGHTCAPDCPSGCSVNAKCTAPGVCTCNTGYTGNGISCKDPNAKTSETSDANIMKLSSYLLSFVICFLIPLL